MSIGYCGYADLVDCDESLVLYSYCCYNLNNSDSVRFKATKDGELYIARESFIEPEIHEKLKKMTSGKKQRVVKRVIRDFSIDNLLEIDKIRVINASGTWQTTATGNDIIAIKLLFRLFNEYQRTGRIPEHVDCFY